MLIRPRSFVHDSNYIVGSFAKLFRDLERHPKSSSHRFFDGSRSSPQFEALLTRAKLCEVALPPMSKTPCPAILLPPILNVQMYTVVGNNKSICILFLVRACCKRYIQGNVCEFHVSRSHYYDIDALFGRWNMSLRKTNFPSIPLLMKYFMEVELVPTIPHLIEEVPNFKGYIAEYIADRDEALEGHIKFQQFKFFMDSIGCFMMKDRILHSDNDWLPKEGGGIKL
jgi:hypothetical protein